MFRSAIFFTILLMGGSRAGYADNANSENTVGSSNGGSASSATGTGFGYSGGFSGNSENGGSVPTGNIPQPPDFSGYFSTFVDSLNKYHKQYLERFPNNNGGGYSYSFTSTSPNAQANAKSSLIFDPNINKGLQAHLQEVQKLSAQGGQAGVPSGLSNSFGTGFGSGSSFGGSYGGSLGGDSNQNSYGGPVPASFNPGPVNGGAAASAAINPGNVHQTASVFPENPASPNVDVITRFGPAPPNGVKHYSVYSSSQSHTSNINGKVQGSHKASTTVNDNGKITTYTTKN